MVKEKNRNHSRAEHIGQGTEDDVGIKLVWMA